MAKGLLFSKLGSQFIHETCGGLKVSDFAKIAILVADEPFNAGKPSHGGLVILGSVFTL